MEGVCQLYLFVFSNCMLGDISKSEASKMLIQNYENTTAIMQNLYIADLQYFSCQKQGHQGTVLFFAVCETT
jgi:hypothetical protein